ncbi:hypothetical protein [Phenylobacterium sp. SCN 70-31]|uniref:hypothetical protein n=1 Tax=Phenylobacterium sp. SCN 70-31 TaxID=1660129 RepID=UPI0008698197|nr:hypothetical protein [Phenylobacterium sp. SCN 70-31]ODT88123.1 MAG: hypothetical protein ABS78_09535 [Phenylobacterium sp. SCN 70-31]
MTKFYKFSLMDGSPVFVNAAAIVAFERNPLGGSRLYFGSGETFKPVSETLEEVHRSLREGGVHFD